MIINKLFMKTEKHTKVLKSNKTRLETQTIQDIYTWLFDSYGTISTAKIEANNEKLKAPYNASQPYYLVQMF